MPMKKSFKIPETPVFHYCPIESFLNILITAEIFLSHSQYLNDPMESKWIRKVIPKCERQLGIKFDFFYIRKIRQFFSAYKGEAYLASFSSEKDMLSQWRSYADDGFGVSIGFDTKKIKKLMSNDLKYEAVIYNNDSQIHQTTQALKKYIPYEEFDITIYNNFDLKSKIRNPYYHIDKEKDLAYNKLLQKEMDTISLKNILNKKFIHDEIRNIAECIKELIILSHSIKNTAFHEEKEYRLCYLPIFKSLSSNMNEKLPITGLKHRHSEKKIVPYYSLNFSENKTIIKEIVLGPRCKLDDYSIRSLLKNNGYKDVIISRSEASYQR